AFLASGNHTSGCAHLKVVEGRVRAGGRDTRRDAEFTEDVTARGTAPRRAGPPPGHGAASPGGPGAGRAAPVEPRADPGRGGVGVDARGVLVREFLRERRSGWARRVSPGPVPDRAGPSADHDAAVDLRAALAGLPPRQRATLVLRFYCDLTIDQAAEVLRCSAGTVKSQTAKGLDALRRALEPATRPAGVAGRSAHPREAAEHGKGTGHG